MKKITKISTVILIILFTACRDQLDIENPNAPKFSRIQTENGLMNFALGGIYTMNTNYSGQGFFWNGVWAFHELMGDAIGCEPANIGMNQIACPDLVKLDNGTVIPSPQPPHAQKKFIRQRNLNQNQGNNPLYYEWAIMYSLNNAANMILALADDVPMAGDSITVIDKVNTLKSWSYFWKGFAYSRIGSMYYAGIINNDSMKTNNRYVSQENIIKEADKNFNKADSILNLFTDDVVYNETLGKLIPSICQVGNGGVLTPAMWKRHMNTMRARNILVNTPVASMTPAQLNDILNLTSNGIQQTDKTFTVRSNATADLMSANSGNVAARIGIGRFFQVSERLIQDFKPADNRLANNFKLTTLWKGNVARGNSFNTRWQPRNGGAGMPGVMVYQNRALGAHELYMAGFYEENELMKAEANIYLGNVDAGLAIIDNIRALQGAGLPAVAGTGLTQAQAITELRSERRVALAFRGFSFYDARRWDVINTGRTGAIVVDFNGAVNTNATINYNFLDYWDVPDNELEFNPPAPGSTPVKNPNGL